MILLKYLFTRKFRIVHKPYLDRQNDLVLLYMQAYESMYSAALNTAARLDDPDSRNVMRNIIGSISINTQNEHNNLFEPEEK